ncbi:hypothetical protein C0995_008532 [Termitomyces sp. Mi166|nr:hypothetical protein C0995_008532 [Termitomyces sp. Mi166\
MTAQCFVHFSTGPPGGRFRSRCHGFTEPMGDEPYDVGIAGLRKTDNLILPGQSGRKRAGVEGALVLAAPVRGVPSVSGNFKMYYEGEVVYKRHVKLVVQYGLYDREGHGRRTDSEFAFWAIHLRECDALAEGNVALLANHAGVGSGVNCTNLVSGEDSNRGDVRSWFEDSDLKGPSYSGGLKEV